MMNPILTSLIFGGSSNVTADGMATSGGASDAGKVITVGSDGKTVATNLTVGSGEVAIDTTLAVTGSAPDSKVVGDKFTDMTLTSAEITALTGLLN